MSKSYTLPFREIREEENALAEQAYKDNKKTAIVYYIVAGFLLVFTTVIVAALGDTMLMVIGIGTALVVSTICFLLGKNHARYPHEIFYATVVNKSQSGSDQYHDYYFVICMVPSSDGTHEVEKHFELPKTEYDKAQIGSQVCIIKQTRFYNYVCVVPEENSYN